MLAGTVRSYLSLLTQHIHKEDTILFPMISCRVSTETQAEIARQFENFEADETGIGEHEWLHELAESLITAHLPRPQAEMHAHYG
jgi:hemerythrin-like domain-containing protein